MTVNSAVVINARFSHASAVQEVVKMEILRLGGHRQGSTAR